MVSGMEEESVEDSHSIAKRGFSSAVSDISLDFEGECGEIVWVRMVWEAGGIWIECVVFFLFLFGDSMGM